MPLAPTATTASIDSPEMRGAGRELLSLALMDARNHTLYLLGQYEQVLGDTGFAVPQRAGLEPPLWLAGHIGWFAEFWIGRNTQRNARDKVKDGWLYEIAQWYPRAAVYDLRKIAGLTSQSPLGLALYWPLRSVILDDQPTLATAVQLTTTHVSPLVRAVSRFVRETPTLEPDGLFAAARARAASYRGTLLGPRGGGFDPATF